MEDSPHFNAGYGAALTEAGEHELDASIMDGATLAAGAVCAVRRIRNPVRAARAVMEKSDCVLLAGDGRRRFAERDGLAMVENSYFTTERRVAALATLKAARRRHHRAWRAKPRSTARSARSRSTPTAISRPRPRPAASTTSRVGRVGDSADHRRRHLCANGVCAVSCTGQGEIFIRRVAAHDVAARMDMPARR